MDEVCVARKHEEKDEEGEEEGNYVKGEIEEESGIRNDWGEDKVEEEDGVQGKNRRKWKMKRKRIRRLRK